MIIVIKISLFSKSRDYLYKSDCSKIKKSTICFDSSWNVPSASNYSAWSRHIICFLHNLTLFCLKLKAKGNTLMPNTAFIVLLFPNVLINRVTLAFFLDKRGTAIPRYSWNSKDAKRQAVQRREPSTSCKGLCCSFTSPWNDVGVWHLKRDQRGSHISIHLHHSQLIAGNLRVVAFGRICNWSRHCQHYNKC